MPKLSDYIKLHPKQKYAMNFIGKGHLVFFGGRRGGGKAVNIYSPVLTPFGFKEMREIKVGSLVCNPDGGCSTVIGVYPQGREKIYKVKFCDDAEVECSGEHLWKIWITNKSHRKRGKIERRYKIMTTLQMIDHLKKEENTITNRNLCVPLTEPVSFNVTTKGKKVDPYLVGLLIGDGCLRGSGINLCSEDPYIVGWLFNRAIEYGYNIRVTNRDDKVQIVNLSNCGFLNGLLKDLNLHGKLAQDKFIPHIYKHSKIEDRFALIQGLMDTDGYVDDRGHMSYTTVSEQLAKDFQWVVRSLGAKATITSKQGRYKNDNGEYVECQVAYTIYFNSNHNEKFVSLPRKKARCTSKKYNGDYKLHRQIVSIEDAGFAETQCITVDDPNGLFITQDFIVTHNSFCALAAAVISALKYPGLKAVAIRETYPELEESYINPLLDNYPDTVFKYKYKDKSKTALFSNGSRIIFRAVDNDLVVKKVQGIEYQLMIVDEAPNQKEMTIHKLIGSLRRSKSKLPGFIPSLFMTGNPGGRSDAFFKTRFIRPNYKSWTEGEINNKDKYVFIESSVGDNPSVGEEYVEMLRGLPENLRRAWLDGDWDVFDGQFFEEWNPFKHIVTPFEIPEAWKRIFCFDLGYQSHPAVGLWLAQDPNSLDVYVYREYVMKGVTEQYINDIINMNGDEHIDQWFADPSMWAEKRDKYVDQSPAFMFLSEGIPLTPANNNRVNGWRIVKQWLHWTSYRDPKLKVFSTCDNLITTLPTLRYSTSNLTRTDDLDTHQDDDACFAEGTLIMTKDGDKKIEDVIIGDYVLTRFGFCKVIDSGCTGIKDVYEYNLNGIKISSTINHKIFINGKKCKIDNIKLYDYISRVDCQEEVRSLSKSYLGKQKVYNLTIEQNHEYFANGILVSNCDALRYGMVTGFGYPTVSFENDYKKNLYIPKTDDELEKIYYQNMLSLSYPTKQQQKEFDKYNTAAIYNDIFESLRSQY